MLSGLIVGDAISSHDGVHCFPAIRRGTEEKYILKIISIPASSSKLEALLLAGAVPNKEAARVYFKDLAKDVLRQADFLRDMSQQEGFVAYLDSHMVPTDDKTGYEVYLLSTYKQSLESIFQTEPMTHADILNMGLDLCAALSACRRAGMLYVDLKPGNIFRDPQAGYRIGDVGFISLSSLKYAVMPDKYRSSYTAPELMDDFAELNATVDIYALGLILYQAYNGGVLPFAGKAPAEPLPCPMYADYEMAQIIAKACHPEPSQRWQDPTQMAQVLIGYMQEYGAAEMPIIPPAVDIVEAEEPVEEFLPEIDPLQLQEEMAALEEDAGELDFLTTLVNDETAPSEENAGEVSEDVLSEDLCEMLAQADSLIAHELPQPPVAPEPIEVPMPTYVEPEAELPDEAKEALPAELEEAPAETDREAAPDTEEDTPEEATSEATELPTPEEEDQPEEEVSPAPVIAEAQPKKTFVFPKKLAVALVVILLLLGIGSWASHYYNQVYTLIIHSIVMENTFDTLNVQVFSDAEEGLLRVICADSYGNSQESAVVGGIAQFRGLKPNTRYTVRVITDEKHRVVGYTTDSFTTPQQTVILSFIADIGPEDCSVDLHFTVNGPETGNWLLRYSAPGIAEQTQQFTGHSTTIYGLSDGALYTFTLESDSQLYMAGTTQVQYLATNILVAKELQITACGGGSLTVQWQQPENGNVSKWRVRCYNEDGYDVTVLTNDCSYTFTDLTHGSPCTVEVIAEGMERSVSTVIAANPITIKSFTHTITDEMGLMVQWQHLGPAPEGGWLLTCRIGDGVPFELRTAEPSALLMLLPETVYSFSIAAADGRYLFGAEQSLTTSELTLFSDFGIDAAQLQASLYVWPDADIWDWTDIPEENYRNSFTYGETAGLLLTANTDVAASENSVNVQFVLVGANGMPIRMDSASLIWNGMWQDGHCCLSVPYLPEVPGTYSLLLYFDGKFVCQQEITIV